MKEWLDIYDEQERTDPIFQPDAWQKTILKHKGDLVVRTGRQCGKSEVVGRKCAKLAIEYDGITILMIAAAQRQSAEIFKKTFRRLDTLNQAVLKSKGGFKPPRGASLRRVIEAKRTFEQENGIFDGEPTKTEFRLKNGTRVLSLPTGKTGNFVRCYTVDILIPDEAAYIPEPVWTAVRPMLATSKKIRGLGWEILLSTPFGRGGHFYECCHDPEYLQIHVTSEECPRIDRDFLKKERLRLTKLEYAQEYLAEFVSEFNQFFSSELVKERMTFISWDYKQDYNRAVGYYLGVDVARYGADENAFVIAELDRNNHIKIVACETSERRSITDTAGFVKHLDTMYNFKKIFIDDGGIGAGLTDILIEKLGKYKVVGINNSKKTIDQDRKKGILKEDLYSNALRLMESTTNPIDIIADLKLQRSLTGMTFEYTSDANLRIKGKYSHLSEAFVRACWCVKSKGLKLFAA